jgi:glutamate racemase
MKSVKPLAPMPTVTRAVPKALPAASRPHVPTAARSFGLGIGGSLAARPQRAGTSAALLRPPRAGAADTPAPETSPAPRSPLDSLLTAFDGRKLSRFHVAGGAVAAAKALEKCDHVMLLTGFSVAENMPETDGPPGTAALGRSLQALGKVVTYVSDPANAPVLRAAVAALNPEAEKFARFEVFDEQHGRAKAAALALVDKIAPDAVVAIELPGRNAEGIRRNMRGADVNGFNGPVDQLLIEANKRGLTTVGVGDGGNEAGMGGLQGVPKALDGSTMATAVKAQHPVTAWNSNLGADAIGAVMLQRAGKLDSLHTPAQLGAAIEATLESGAVDGVTRKAVAGDRSDDGESVTGVDGFRIEVHGAMLDMLRNVAGGIAPGIHARQTPKGDAPFLIAAFDSSNGGFVAAKNLAGFIEHRSNSDARFLILADHGEAPYGDKTPQQLQYLVGKGLKTAEQIGVDVIVMVCNTACTAFPEAKDGIRTPVIDLIATTSQAIAEHGGDRPSAFSTPATAKDPMYPDKVKAASQGKQNLKMVGVESWATLVNDLKHLADPGSADGKAAIREVNREVKKYVAKVDPLSTSVWLCCTHYPALKPMIERAMRDRGLGHIPVIDPMEYQAAATTRQLDQTDRPEPGTRRQASRPVVLSTGEDEAKVSTSASKLLGMKPAAVLFEPALGVDVSTKVVREMLYASADDADADKPANPAPSKPNDPQPPRGGADAR